MAAVGRATALAFARVLAFAAVVAGLATAFAFAGIHSLTGVNVFFFLRVAHLRERGAGFAGEIGRVCLDGERAAHEAGYCCAGEDGFRFHVFLCCCGLFLLETGDSPELVEAGLNKFFAGETGCDHWLFPAKNITRLARMVFAQLSVARARTDA
jgi:hypothetical protein